MINKVQLLGRVGKDPETRSFDNGDVTSFSVATSKSYRKNDEWIEQTEWHNINAWGKLSEKAATIKKGDLVWVEGELSTRKYDKEGQTHYNTSIKSSYIRKINTSNEGSNNGQSAGGLQGNAFAPVSSSNDNDLPF